MVFFWDKLSPLKRTDHIVCERLWSKKTLSSFVHSSHMWSRRKTSKSSVIVMENKMLRVMPLMCISSAVGFLFLVLDVQQIAPFVFLSEWINNCGICKSCHYLFLDCTSSAFGYLFLPFEGQQSFDFLLNQYYGILECSIPVWRGWTLVEEISHGKLRNSPFLHVPHFCSSMYPILNFFVFVDIPSFIFCKVKCRSARSTATQ